MNRFQTSFGFNSSGSDVSLSYMVGVPDPSGLISPQLVVIFKNLLKRDSITKEKALNEFLQLINTQPEDEVMALLTDDLTHYSWVQMYPKLSIDVSRQVRILSHKLQGIIGKILGKQLAKYLKESLGSWLCGTFDTDRQVARSATSALELVFPAEEKRLALYKLFLPSLLDFVHNAIAHETIKSLSDERFIILQDAEAKFARVNLCCISLLGKLLAHVPTTTVEKTKSTKHTEASDKLIEIIEEPKLWACTHSKDPFLAKVALDFTARFIVTKPELITPEILVVISTNVLQKSLPNAPATASIELIKCITLMTLDVPTCWDVAVVKKHSSFSQLIRFIKSGSQNAGAQYWTSLTQLLSVVEIPQSYTKKLLNALLEVIPKEPMLFKPSAVLAYFSVIFAQLSKTNDATESTLLTEHLSTSLISTILSQDIKRLSKNLLQSPTLCKYIRDCFSNKPDLLLSVWSTVAMFLTEDGTASEVVNDKQIEAIDKLAIWYMLSKTIYEILAAGDATSQGSTTQYCSIWVNHLNDLLNIIRASSPPSSSAKMSFAIQCTSVLLINFYSQFMAQEATAADITDFVSHSIPSLIVSDSSDSLIRILILCAQNDFNPALLSQVVNQCFKSVTLSSYHDKRDAIFAQLLKTAHHFYDKIEPSQVASDYLYGIIANSVELSEENWELLSLGLNACKVFITVDASNLVLDTVVENFINSGLDYHHGLEVFSKLKHSTAISSYLLTDTGASFLSKLWAWSDDHALATDLTETELELVDDFLGGLERLASSTNLAGGAQSGVTCVDNSHIAEVMIQTLLSDILTSSIANLSGFIMRAVDILNIFKKSSDDTSSGSKLFYSADAWVDQFAVIFAYKPNTAIAHYSISGQIALLVTDGDEYDPSDRELSEAIRKTISMTLYSLYLLKQIPTLLSELEDPERTSLVINILNGMVVLFDYHNSHNDASISEHFDDWYRETSSILSLFQLDDITTVISKSDTPFSSELVSEVLGEFVQRASSISVDPTAYYAGRVLYAITAKIAELQYTHIQLDQVLEKLNIRRRSKEHDHVINVALMAAFSSSANFSSTTDRLRNQVASELINIRRISSNVIANLVYINVLFNGYICQDDFTESPFPLPRFNMLANSLFMALSNVEDPANEDGLKFRIAIAKFIKYTMIGMNVDDIGSKFWEQVLDFIEDGLVQMEITPDELLAVSLLELFSKISTKIKRVINLQEAWLEEGREVRIYDELLTLLIMVSQSDLSDANTISLDIQKLLCKLSSNIPISTIEENFDNLFSFLATGSIFIERAGFNMLHKIIPQRQEQLSIALELQKQTIHDHAHDEDGECVDCENNISVSLPMELISLILDPPTSLESLSDPKIFGYFLTWATIYDHFENTTYGVRHKYIEELKNNGYVDILFKLIAEIIETHQSSFKKFLSSRSLDTEVAITAYGSTSSELLLSDSINGLTTEVMGLVINVYYNALRHTGSIAKNWFISLKRHLTIIIEQFTEKYVSPLVINQELNTVQTALESPSSDINDENMSIKISKNMNEIKAFYTVDEQTMEIVVKIPSVYPLKPIVFEGVKRIGARENQWRAWLLASQAIVSSQNGTVMDSLQLFKRNVTLHFDGVEDCAICYSILHQDHTLPSKTCSTCKNKFHASCLYKWFKSSNSSTCPLCRQSFSFRSGV